ncbi:hypothetical protein [Ornithinimicrobium faecis]|uniref:hypothetical protein n=1 Tax=Ornithinimicrobium faecis TaxID=2934158 RepID=UPI0021177C10|nr:hypothetical protein [Ornithinimicrobium sp. HY1745]
MAAAYRTGLPVPRRSVVLHELRGSSHGSTEPLTAIEHVLGEPFLAHIGVRTGANAKATAQLFSPSGDVLGYAKVAWNDITATYVRTETARLTSLAGTSGVLRTPRVRGVGEAFGMPFVILEPLPKDVTRLHKPTDLTVGDLSAISPIARFDHAASTAWFERLMARLENFREVPALRKVVGSVLDLADRLSADQTRLPVTAYDHGDLVPWNASRDRDGSLWVWDWESSEEDTVAGGDAIHWFVHSVSGPVPRDLAAAILRASELALPTHRAIGMGTHESRVATAAYALATADRACSLAAQHRTWARNRVGEDTVLDVIRLGKALLGHD